MNVKQAEKKLRELIRRKPSIQQPGRLLGHLMNELGVETDSKRTQSSAIELALEKLEAVGLIEVQRSGSVLNGYRAIPQQTSKNRPAAKASGQSPTPSVPVRALAPTIPESTEEVKTMNKTEVNVITAEQVTLALNVLQIEADENGHIRVKSIPELIAKELDVPLARANTLNGWLYDLGLRTSPVGRNPRGERPHWVNTEVDEVTDEMLKAAKSGSSPSKTSVPSEEVETSLLGIIEKLEGQLEEHKVSSQSAERLTDIIDELEKRLAERDEAIIAATKKLDELTAASASLAEERNVLQAKLDDTERQLRENRAQLLKASAPSKRVLDVLERYGKR